MAYVVESWRVLDADAAARGVDLAALPLRRLLNLAYITVLRSATDEADRAMLDAKLHAPLSGRVQARVTREDDASEEMSMFESFQSMMG